MDGPTAYLVMKLVRSIYVSIAVEDKASSDNITNLIFPAFLPAEAIEFPYNKTIAEQNGNYRKNPMCCLIRRMIHVKHLIFSRK